ncbi:MAG: stage 0 sporulation family protein, partial [Nitrospinota bacterium]
FPYPLRKVLRVATPDDHRLVARHMELERRALKACHQRVAEQKLPMRLAASEFTFDGKKAIFYFTAERRVDFRRLVKSLARQFRVRIEMRQIGVRDEARMLGGHGPCGRRLCCSVYLNEFEPVSIRMAKVQNLTLNPSKISGVCGRLMCCLLYEHGAYQQLRASMPKCGREVMCSEGPCKVVKTDLLHEQVTLELQDGRRFKVPLDRLDLDEVKLRE